MARDGRKMGIAKVPQFAAMHQSRCGDQQVHRGDPLAGTGRCEGQLASHPRLFVAQG